MTLIVDYTLRPALFHVISKGFFKTIYEAKTNGKSARHFDRTLVIIKLKSEDKNFA